MKSASLKSLVVTASLVALTAQHAAADSRVFLLQLGSFESEAQAQTRWLRLRDKYPDLLQGLNVRTLDVTLPPDNFTVYRTQAGALESRSDAQIICDRLSSAGDECYVVETAMFKPQAAAPAVAAPQPTIQMQAPAPVTQAVDSIETAYEDMETALIEAEAAAPNAASELSAAAPTIAFDAPAQSRNEEESSFWDWINPFSSSQSAATTVASAAPTSAPAPVSAPVAPVTQYQLPAPPAPTQGYAAAPAPVANYATPQPPAMAPASTIPFQIKRDGQPVDAPDNFIPNSSGVQVAEAIRVPVSEIQRVSPAPASAAQLRALGMPSQSLPNKNMWAEVTYFNTQQDALAFWDEFRWANPGFPPVRVRVTNPYLRTSSPRVSLRVGPFDQQSFIGDICNEVINNTDRNCQMARDLGASSTARMGARTRANSNNRYHAMSRQTQVRAPMYWVQLGTYNDSGAAHNAWRMLQQRHEPLLNDMKPDLAVATQSSAMQSNYRLRTGPFPMRGNASALCGMLQGKGTNCVTVYSR